tara:strand:+ start:123 stop:230 length:108 start_codon:yes stop_codon:yes gene_type:complete
MKDKRGLEENTVLLIIFLVVAIILFLIVKGLLDNV